MKKSKVIIPAMAMILFSTAASISGTVAWFTANRVFTMTAGNFAVVSTKDNLECTMSAGIGTYIDNDTHAVTVGAQTSDVQETAWADTSAATTAIAALTASDVGKIFKQTDNSHYWVCTAATKAVDMGTALPDYKLTDASFDHTDVATPLIVPDGDGLKVAYKPNITTADVSTAGILRDASEAAGVVFSAFTWEMTFTVSFGANPSASHVGLYLNTGAANTWMKMSDDTEPTDTGKAFKIAFVPKTVPAGCLGVTKVWGQDQTSEKTTFVDGLAVGADLAATAYGSSTYTTQFTESSRVACDGTSSAKTVTSTQALASSDANHNKTAPAHNTDSIDNCLQDTNGFGIGYFASAPSTPVSMTYLCVAFFEGTDENIETAADTVYQTMKVSMEFQISNLTD